MHGLDWTVEMRVSRACVVWKGLVFWEGRLMRLVRVVVGVWLFVGIGRVGLMQRRRRNKVALIMTGMARVVPPRVISTHRLIRLTAPALGHFSSSAGIR